MTNFANIDWLLLKPLRLSLKNPDTGEPFTQAHVAKVAGCSQGYIARIEKGEMRKPNEEIVEGIANALRMQVVSLLQQLERGIEDKPLAERPNIVQITHNAPPKLIPLYEQPYMETDAHFRLSDGILLEGSGHIECPPFLKDEEGAYAVKLWHDAMEPRFHPNDILFVNPNLTAIAGEDVIVQIRHKSEDAPKHRWVGFVRELVRVDYEMQQDTDGNASYDTSEAFLWAHNLQDKGRKTYNGDFKTHHGYDPLESYEPKCEQYLMNDHGGVKLHLIVGVQKARMTRHYTLKAEPLVMKAEVGQVEIKVERGKK